MFRYSFFIFITIFSGYSIVFGSNPVVNIIVNPTAIGTNESAEIRIEVVNQKLLENPVPSTHSDNFTITYRGTSSQKQINIINGSIDVKNTTSYIYQFTPHASGQFTIPTFIIHSKNGNKSYSPSSSITVEATDRLRASNPRTQSHNPFNAFFNEPTELFVELRPSRTILTQNTSFIIDVYLFSDNSSFFNNTGNLQQIYMPRFEGGLYHIIPINQKNNDIVTEQYGYNTLYGKLIAKYIAFPLEKGKLSFFPPVFTTKGTFQNYNLAGDPIEIQSVPITTNITYIGDNLIISNYLNTNIMTQDQEYQLDFTIEGDGNVDFFTNPFSQISLSNIFISSPKSTLELGFYDQNNSNHIFMKKTLSYTVIPKESGEFTLPSVGYNFTTVSGKLTNISTEPITFKVQPNTIKKENLKGLTPLPVPNKIFTYHSGIEYIIASVTISIILLLISLLQAKNNTRLANDPAYARLSNAKKRLHKIMMNGEEAINKKQYKEAARLIRQSILYFCTDKFNLPNSSSPQEIIDFLNQKNISFDLKEIFLETMNTLDFYAFAQTPSEIQIREYLTNAYQILDVLSSIKNK